MKTDIYIYIYVYIYIYMYIFDHISLKSFLERQMFQTEF